MIKFLKLIARGRKAVVPEPMFARESSQGLNPLRAPGVGGSATYTNTIPNRTMSVTKDKYTPPPKNTPFAVIPKNVCRNC